MPQHPPSPDKHTRYLRAAREQACKGMAEGEIPVGAVLYDADGTLLAGAHNLTETLRDPTAHAEMLALQAAIKATGKRYFEDCTLAVTLEPCAMCMGALVAARVGTVLFGAYDPKSGGTVNGARVPDHAHFRPEILGGLDEDACRDLLQTFFRTIREDQKR